MNDAQNTAVAMTEGPVITVAGPGSGKTTVIVSRLHHMLQDNKIRPENILVITYTKAAALEMRARFLVNADEASQRVNFGTFHSIFFQILKKQYGYTRENILTEDVAVRIIISLLGNENDFLLSSLDFVKALLDEIAQYKGMEEDKKREFKSALLENERFFVLLSGYNTYLEDMKLVDFEDMLQKTHELLKTDPAALGYWQNKFRYILVDEFQDINPVQYRITKLLAAPQNNLFVVGDDDQSIYAFRGSAPEIMAAFLRDYPNAKEIMLDINYRSGEEILSAASNLISNNSSRYKKNLRAARGSLGENVQLKSFPTAESEYAAIAKDIREQIDAGTDPKEIAVLTRTNNQSGFIAAVLLNSGIPFVTKSGIPSLYDNRYVRPLLAYIRFLAGDHSRENFLLFMNKPVRYIERAALTNSEVDLDELIAYYENLEKWYVVKNLQDLKNDMHMLSRLDSAGAIHYLRKVTGYDAYIKDSVNISEEYVSEIMDRLDEFENSSLPHRSFVAFMEYISDHKKKLSLAAKEAPENAVNMLTFHGCKGLEFDAVYMPDCEEDITPHKKSRTPSELEEERRMFYVAMTRARNRLFISCAERRHGKEQKTSRFVREIKTRAIRPEVGMSVKHVSYQYGTIIKVEGDNLTVKFDKLLVPKKFSYSFCMEKGLMEILR